MPITWTRFGGVKWIVSQRSPDVARGIRGCDASKPGFHFVPSGLLARHQRISDQVGCLADLVKFREWEPEKSLVK